MMGDKRKVFKSVVWIGFSIYILLLIKLILLKDPQHFFIELKHLSKDNIEKGESNLILIPFQTTWVCLSGEKGLWGGIANIGGNLFGFVPMGILLPLLFSRLGTAIKVIATIFLISLCFELTQFFTGVGYCDIDDLIQNTLGGAIGFWVYNKWIRNRYSTSTKAAQE